MCPKDNKFFILIVIVGILLFCYGISEGGQWKAVDKFTYTYVNDVEKTIADIYLDVDCCWYWEVNIKRWDGYNYSGGGESTTLLDAVNEVERILSYYYWT